MTVKASFADSTEIRTPDKTRVEVVDLNGVKAARMTFEPGWRWSTCVQPVVGTQSCQVRHVGTAVSGTLVIRQDDGSEVSVTEGDAYVIDPGHDAWVDGDVTFVGLEFDDAAATHYAST